MTRCTLAQKSCVVQQRMRVIYTHACHGTDISSQALRGPHRQTPLVVNRVIYKLSAQVFRKAQTFLRLCNHETTIVATSSANMQSLEAFRCLSCKAHQYPTARTDHILQYAHSKAVGLVLVFEIVSTKQGRKIPTQQCTRCMSHNLRLLTSDSTLDVARSIRHQ